MRIPNNVRSGEIGFNMTPMIDVVFLLIIFFLVSSHLAKQEVHLDLPLPVADSGNAPSDETSPRVTINVLRDGAMMLAGKTVVGDDLQRRLRQRVAVVGVDLEVRIRGNREVPYRFVEPILLACARAGIWNVTFAVYRPEDLR